MRPPRSSLAVQSIPGLYVIPRGIKESTQKELLQHYFSDRVVWFQRFGKRWAKTAHFNGHHVLMNDKDHADVLVPAITEALQSALLQSSHPTLHKMRDSPDEIAVAAMKHEPNWGLGPHIDVYAPKGVGLVIMITVANTREVHRVFRFTQRTSPTDSPTRHCDISTPSGTVVVFTEEAYEEWMHESCKNPKQDGTCISLTVRLRDIDGYDGWQVPQSVCDEAKSLGLVPKRYRSHKFAIEQMNERKRRRQENLCIAKC